MPRSGSLKLRKPVFNGNSGAFNKRHPPIQQLLNSSGESTGGSSELEDYPYGSISVVDQSLGHRRCSLSSISSLSEEGSSAPTSTSGQGQGQGSSGPGRSPNDRSPYSVIIDAMANDPKWRQERQVGRLVGLYRINGEIGTGNFARVRLGVHQLIKEKVAVKIIDKTRVEPKLEKMLSREVSCMESLTHPNIVRLYEVIESPSKLYLISEWAPAGDLYAKVTLRGQLSETEAKPIFRQILSAVTYMHNNGVIHRDLKAENIFFSTGTHCKVGDFGFATSANKGQLLSTFCGSPPYAAPELFRDENYEGAHVDIWALGVLLYFMIEGCLPFVGTSIPALKKAILLGEYEMSPTVSFECLDLIQGILQQKPKKRMTLSQIIRHIWLQRCSSSSGDSVQEHELIRRQDTTALLLPATQNRALSKSVPTREQVNYGLLSPAELKAFEIVQEIGISEDLMDRERGRGSRSHVVGIYRIILHKLQEGRGINPKQFHYNPNDPSNSISKPKGLPVPSVGSSSGSSSSGKNGFRTRTSGGGQSLRKQLAVHGRSQQSYEDNQMSTTCNIL